MSSWSVSNTGGWGSRSRKGVVRMKADILQCFLGISELECKVSLTKVRCGGCHRNVGVGGEVGCVEAGSLLNKETQPHQTQREMLWGKGVRVK